MDDAGLNQAMNDGEKIKLTGSVEYGGATFVVNYERQAGEYGGSSISIPGSEMLSPEVREGLADEVIEHFDTVLGEAVNAAQKAFDAHFSQRHTSSYNTK